MIGECELTGKKNVELFRVKIEGTIMNVCKEAVKFGERVDKPTEFKTKSFTPRAYADQDDVYAVKNISQLVKQARERKGLKQGELARLVSEKESTIHAIESGHHTSNLKLAKKLEKFFHIKLTERLDTTASTQTVRHSSQPLTMEAAFKKALEKKK